MFYVFVHGIILLSRDIMHGRYSNLGLENHFDNHSYATGWAMKAIKMGRGKQTCQALMCCSHRTLPNSDRPPFSAWCDPVSTSQLSALPTVSTVMVRIPDTRLNWTFYLNVISFTTAFITLEHWSQASLKGGNSFLSARPVFVCSVCCFCQESGTGTSKTQ